MRVGSKERVVTNGMSLGLAHTKRSWSPGHSNLPKMLPQIAIVHQRPWSARGLGLGIAKHMFEIILGFIDNCKVVQGSVYWKWAVH
eukprot:2410664-Karenia_brevis.AAC.1